MSGVVRKVYRIKSSGDVFFSEKENNHSEKKEYKSKTVFIISF
jgi:hypothetical protein